MDEHFYNPHDPEWLKSNSGEDIPRHLPVTIFPGQPRHPKLKELKHLLECNEPGSVHVPAPVLLVNKDDDDPASRSTHLVERLWIPNSERCRHTAIIAPSGGGKNQKVEDHLALYSIRSPAHSALNITGKLRTVERQVAEARRVGKRVVVISLADTSISHGFEPLATDDQSLAREHVQTISDLTRNRNASETEFWHSVVRLALFGCWQEGYRSLPAMRHMLSQSTSELAKIFSGSTSPSFRKLNELFGSGATNSNLDTCQATIAGVLDTMLPGNAARVFGNPEIDLESLWTGEPVVVIVLVPQDSVATYAAANGYVVSTLADSLLRTAEREGEGRAKPRDMHFEDLLCVGPVLSYEKLLAYRSRNIGVTAGVQSIVGLRSVYGDNDGRTLFEGFANKVVLPGIDPADAQVFACHSGTQRVCLDGGAIFEQTVLSADEIRCPSYKHFLLGQPATFFVAGKCFQAYLQNAYESPENRHLYRNDPKLSEVVKRSTPLCDPVFRVANRKQLVESHRTDTKGWTKDDYRQYRERMLERIDFDSADPKVQVNFLEFGKNGGMELFVALVDDLVHHHATLQEFANAHDECGTGNIWGILHFMLFRREKRKEDGC